MDCPHSAPFSSSANRCGLGLYGGRPSHGTCAACMSRGENTPAHAAELQSRYDKAFPPDKRGTLKECGC